ncbi:hypothetical protein F4777DRAFT_81911 [Nemania sp. FL0916]|nr:hypothetical protein F4777DRAFT_81911 [Nemania sp. FL0916]
MSYFPLNSQLPPVARVAEPFSFAFSPLTFSSDTKMSYTLADGAPAWLSLDSASRTLSGTPDDALIPPSATLVGVVITLVASDDTGSAAANATLVVSRGSAPVVRIPLEDQIEKFGPYSAPASVLLHPSTQFSFEFDPNTFGTNTTTNGQSQVRAQDILRREENKAANRPELNYYAVSGDNAPLPSWIKFDAEKLVFSGKTPRSESLIEPPQRFGFRLVASDVVGFSSTSIDFSIVVGNHELTADDSVIELNATRGQKLEYKGLQDLLKLDKKKLGPQNISSITPDGLPPWLTFDKKSWEVSGTPNTLNDEKSTNVTIVVIDKFSDTLNVTLAINFHTKIFLSDLPGLNMSSGDDFSFDLKSFLFAPMETLIRAEIQPGDAWIRFDDSSKVLSGTAPKSPTGGPANDIRVSFDATQIRTKDKEAKNLNIHVNHPPAPSSKPDDPDDKKKDDSNKNYYWLLTVPALAIAAAVIMTVFRARKRRQQPKELDFSELSGPVPGSFVATTFMDTPSYGATNMLDPGPQARSAPPSSSAPGPLPILRTSQTMPNPNTEVDNTIPHAITVNSRAPKPAPQGSVITEMRGSWFSGRQTKLPLLVTTDEVSLLSDTSLGEDVHIVEDLSPKKLPENLYEKKTHLEAPKVTEPFSIQPTPELAYAVTRKYDYVSDDEVPPAGGHVQRRRSGYQQSTRSSVRGVQRRVSNVWKRASETKFWGDPNRHSQLSDSTDATTDTSILTSGYAEEATTASTNVVARPTVIHIPSRPGEARQLSRRTDDSSTFFGGQSLTKSQRNYGLANDTASKPMPMSVEPLAPAPPKAVKVAQNGDTAWDQLARNSLGIAYQDLIQGQRVMGGSVAGPEEARIGVARSQNWDAHTSKELMSPDRWPVPEVFKALRDTADASQNRNGPSKMESPGKTRASLARVSREGGSLPWLQQQTPLAHTRSKARSSRERLSRIREKKQLDEFRAMVSSQPPSPHDEWPVARARQLPETPSRTGRAPLADRTNELGGLKSTLLKRSVKTLRSTKSVRSAWAGEDDDDAWEDIRPPESVVGGWEPEASDGSFPVYI